MLQHSFFSLANFNKVSTLQSDAGLATVFAAEPQDLVDAVLVAAGAQDFVDAVLAVAGAQDFAATALPTGEQEPVFGEFATVLAETLALVAAHFGASFLQKITQQSGGDVGQQDCA